MPTVAETTWGVWGQPSPYKPWAGPPEFSHIDGGGTIKTGFSDTLKWYYKNSSNPADKKHCLNLLAQIEIRKEDAKNRQVTHQKRIQVEKSKSRQKRPQTANSTLSVKASAKELQPRPNSAQPTKASTKETQKKVVTKDQKKGSYRRQIEATERLSRPRTARIPTRESARANQKEATETLRPKSAMATVGRKHFNDPYLTTHEREFQGYPSGLYSEATRPMSSKGFTAPYKLNDPLEKTTCQQEFSWKKTSLAQPILSGTSSGNRRNNPHPHESFMVWKLPRKNADGMITAPAKHLGYKELSDQVMDQILKDQLKSTYQYDYLGIPQGYQVKDAIDAPADWRSQIGRPLHTTVRHSYKGATQDKELTGNVTRYGCNKNKMRPAVGAVPTVTSHHVKNQEQIKGKTTYESQYRNRFSQPNLMKLLNSQTNSKVIDSFLRYSKADHATKNQIKDSSRIRPDSTSSQKGPKWLSDWEGPHHHDVQ